VTRRLALLPLALVATLALVLGACSSPPAAPALTDPKEIVTKGVTSLADVKSFEFTTSFSGTVKADQLGTFDLSGVKMSGAVDLANKTAKFNLDAAGILGTKVDALLIGATAYYKVAGALAVMTGGQADTYTKIDVPDASTNPDAAALEDPTKLVAKLNEALAQLPVQPTKAADEKCGDADCYHVTLALTQAQLQALDPTSAVDGDVTIDLFTRKGDYRPAKLVLTGTSATMGTVGITLEIRYDVGVSVTAPAADQIVTAP
jgi:hypothetical protein